MCTTSNCLPVSTLFLSRGGCGGPDQIAGDPGCTATHGGDGPTDPGEPCRDAAGAVIDCAPPIDGGDPDRGDEPCRDVAGAVVECTPPTDGGDPGRGDEPTPGDDPTPTEVPSAGDPVDSSVEVAGRVRSEENTSELQSLKRIS